MVSCDNCIHFKRAPYEANLTGCWHPDNMPQQYDEAFLQQQQLPGDHEQINLRGDCAQYEARRAPASFLQRLWQSLTGRAAEAPLRKPDTAA